MSENKLSRLIILGAGASVECGFYPTGAQFAQVVRRIWESNKGSQDFLQNPNFRYMENFLLSNHASIDSHISYIDNEEEKNFLKALIVSIILASTAYSALRKDFENNWYHELAKLIFPTVSREKSNQERLDLIEENLKFLHIITFNYDLSLELYLLERAKSFFKQEDEENLESFLKKLRAKIYHVYGCVSSTEKEIIGIFESRKGTILGEMTYSWKNEFYDDASGKVYLRNNSGGGIDMGQRIGFFAAQDERWISRAQAEKLLKYDNIQHLPRNFIDVEEPNHFSSFSNFLKSFEADYSVQPWETYHRDALLKMFLKQSESLLKNEDILSRIKVIGEDRRVATEAKNEDPELDKITLREGGAWDILYVIGYGFDRLNNERLKLRDDYSGRKKYLRWGSGCYVTNFDGNKKLERRIYEELSRSDIRSNVVVMKHHSTQWKIPTRISKLSASNSLRSEFDFFEAPYISRSVITQGGVEPFEYFEVLSRSN
jgi:hypothetical protein